MRQRSRLSRWLTAIIAFLAVPAAVSAQGAVITGTVASEGGQRIEAATVYITSMSIGVQTNQQGVYTLNIPAARLQGTPVFLRVRAIGYRADVFEFTPAAGNLEHNFELETDVNRLSEVVVTGSIEGTERSKVPFLVGRLTTEDVPVPSPNPLAALSGKVPGMRIAQANGKPGSAPEIMMRGPSSINASGRSQSPLIIVDGVIMRVGSLDEIGGLDIESVEVVKGAAGASLYGTTAANGVMIIKTKRGGTQDGVRFNVRSEWGLTDFGSVDYGIPQNMMMGLDETNKRFCVQGSGAVSGCSRTMDFMGEILRINNVNADTTRRVQAFEWNGPSASSGQLQNIFQSNVWPNQYYHALAQVSEQNPVKITSLDATGRTGATRYFVSGGYTDDPGAIKYLRGQQQIRGRVNLDFEARSDLLISVSSLVDQGTTDINGFSFGILMRGFPAGTNALAIDSLGRPISRGGGSGIRGSGNGTTAPLYNPQNWNGERNSQRLLANLTMNYFPADWVTFDASMGYDSRRRDDQSYAVKGYKTTSYSSSTNFGNMSISNLNSNALNGNMGMTVRKQLTSDIASKFNIKGLYDEYQSNYNGSSGQKFVVKDVYTLSNTTTNFSTSSNSSKILNMGLVGGANFDIRGKYIVDGTYRYDGSSLFGAGNRWAPFGRISGVWRISEEPFFQIPHVSDMRFRISRGTAGNTPSFTAQYETYSCGASGCSLGQAGNSKLKPETTTEIESGIDLTLFDRVGLELTNARSTTRNQILNVPTPASLGFSNQWRNAGTLENNTYEVSASLPLITRRDLQWSMRAAWDRTTTFVTQLDIPEYFTSAGGGGTGSIFLISADRTKQDNIPRNRYANLWGRKFYHTCAEMAASLQSQCGEGKAYQVNGQGWVVWTGEGNSWKDGITRNLWQSKQSVAQSPWGVPIYFGHPIIDRPLKGEKGESVGVKHILGTTLPAFRLSYNSTLTYKKLTVYGLLDGTFGHSINNIGEGWGVFDFQSDYFDQAGRTVENATPVGYGWRVGSPEGAGLGGFYDQLGPNNYNVENGTYVKLREMSVSYKLGSIGGVGDWTFGVVGRNLVTFTNYTGYDPETGQSGGSGGSAFINQIDNFNFPTLRSFSFSLSTRF
ncbi:MAG: SusC/RagA family TonB-linked outer membrane protein [Gemmatimonadetes bacterium]|nr:SusC/RagA family TonB-linked outer membrane protein [Gemmatimonadota bacterium]